MIPYAASADIIYRVARQLNSSLDLDEVLGNVLALTVEATNAERGTLFLLDGEGQVTRQIQSSPHKPLEVVRRNIELTMSHGLAGWVYRHQHGALAPNTATDERWITLPDSTHTTGSAVVVPLLRQDTVNGLLALHHSEVRFFDESHLALTAGIAGQAAVAVENARLFTQIKSERESLYTMLNALPVPMLEISPENEIIFANAAAKKSLRIKEAHVLLDSIEGGDQLKAALDNLYSRAEQHIELAWPDNRVFNVSVNNIPQLGTVAVLDDISYLKELDVMKSQFVETVSHDLKNPLTVIAGFADIVISDEDLSETGQTCMDGILHNTQHMQELVQELLDLAQIESGVNERVEFCDMAQIVEEVVLNHKFQANQKNLLLDANLPADTVKVSGNPLRLFQVVSNLVSNAIKYTPTSGEINVDLQKNGSEIWLRVSDNGPGISQAAQSQLFQKFYRVPDIQIAQEGAKSTGLGLSIVKAIVEQYNGRVWVESEVGTGSTFNCAFPYSPESIT